MKGLYVYKSIFKNYRSFSTLLNSAGVEQNVLSKLNSLIEPITSKTLGAIGSVQSVRYDGTGKLVVHLDLGVPGYPHQSELLEMCKAAVSSIGVQFKDCDVRISPPRKYGNVSSLESSSLSNVGHVIGVSSCKGGVGKSTVAVNLAVSLANLGLKVALLDADVYGPSLPHLLSAKNYSVRRSSTNPKYIVPLDSSIENLKMLSFGHVNPKSGAPGSGGKTAAVVRGPIVSKIINQLILSTEWGDLDYLIVDMPPGTGDIQITLTQSVSLTGAVIVTTPHTLSLIDAAKGVAMFEDLKVPTLSIVENMAYFTCEHGKKYYPFGKGGRQKLLQGLTNNVDNQDTLFRLQNCPLLSVPLVAEPDDVSNEIRPTNYTDCSAGCKHDHSDSTSSTVVDIPMPVVSREPESDSGKAYRNLAINVISEIYKSQAEAILTPTVTYIEKKRSLVLRYFTAASAQEYNIAVEELRIRDPQSGLVIPGSKLKSEYSHLIPTKLDFKGKYGVSIVWSDGYFADIFPFHVLKQIAEEINNKKSS